MDCVSLLRRRSRQLVQKPVVPGISVRHHCFLAFGQKSPTEIVRALLGRAGRASTSLINSTSYFILHKIAAPRGAALTERRLSAGKARSLWGVTPILTLPLKVRADRLLGLEAQSLVFATYHITRDFDYNLEKFSQTLSRRIPALGPTFGRLLLIWAVLRYDVFHYFYDRGLMPPVTRFGINPEELDVLHRSGKRVYLYAYGADVRRRELTLGFGKWNFCKGCPEPLKYCVCDDESGSEIMARMCKAVTQPVALGDMLAYVPGARNMHYWPIGLSAIPIVSPARTDGPLLIAHAPNHTHFKGSSHLEAVIRRLQASGHAIEYVKVQGVPNADVIQIFQQADIVADQFIGGAYGYTALEGMACGKPVLTYVRAPDMVEAVAECPLINVTPDTLEETLLWCLENRRRLPAIGAQGRIYVEKWHSIEAVADRFANLYLDTANFPPIVVEQLAAYRRAHREGIDRIPKVADWEHPFRVGYQAPLRQWPFIDPSSQPGDLIEVDAPLEAWHSYDRTPWRHPWLIPDHLRLFSSFTTDVLRQLRTRLADRPLHLHSYAFCGNMANISYMRAAGLRRRGIDLTVYLPHDDPNLMSQPAWEDFEGEIGELGPDPQRAILSVPLPPGVRRLSVSTEWRKQLARGEAGFLNPSHVRDWPDYMHHIDGLRELARHDALLISQLLYFGPLANRPYIIGPMGGEIWFDASRDDTLGRLSRLALRQAYAVIVSNPLTLAHARRYGLNNFLYMPLMIDEERYTPGDAADIRAQWQARSGGDFFVLTSMRLDNEWKGAHLAIEGFAEFVRAHPRARLVVLGWGADEAAARQRLAHSGISHQVLFMPIVGKARLSRYLQAADVLIEQFVLGYYGASGLEAMASGLPVIMRLERAQYDSLISAGAPPVLHATNAAEIATHLSMLYGDPDRRRGIGTKTREWFLKTHSSSHNWRDMMVLLDAAALGLHIEWQFSPLDLPLSAVEIDYHRTQLASAPPFGKYEI